jgi:hypothetical protein
MGIAYLSESQRSKSATPARAERNDFRFSSGDEAYHRHARFYDVRGMDYIVLDTNYLRSQPDNLTLPEGGSLSGSIDPATAHYVVTIDTREIARFDLVPLLRALKEKESKGIPFNEEDWILNQQSNGYAFRLKLLSTSGMMHGDGTVVLSSLDVILMLKQPSS